MFFSLSLISFIKLINKSKNYLIIFYIIGLVILASGRIARWDLLEQIAMADNFIANGVLYPEKDAPAVHGVSVYFPGISILAIIFRYCGVNFYIVEILLLFAVCIFVGFIYVLIKLSKIINNNILKNKDIFIFSIGFLLIVAPNYTLYAVEFKPDTISFFLGYGGLISITSLKKSFNKYFISIISIGAALIFKQQFLAFILGLFLVLMFNKKVDYKIILISILSVSIILIIFFYTKTNLWYWNVTVLSDDGFETLSFISREIILTFARLMCFLLIMTISINHKNLIKITQLINFKIYNSDVHPWFIITPLVIIASLLSFLKSGGNSGNVEFALVLMLPIFAFIVNYLSIYKIILISWIGLFLTVPVYFDSIGKYNKAVELRRQVKLLNKSEINTVLTGSDVYFATRVLSKTNMVIENYWTESLRSNTDPHEKLESLISLKNYSIIVVENLPSNYDVILRSNKYRILFINKLGIIAKINSQK